MQDALPTTDPSLPVLVVGAGPAGLAAMLALRERNIAFQGIEAHSDVGGIWDETNEVSSVYQGMRTASSRATTRLLQPMPRSLPAFVPFKDAKAYLQRVAETEGLHDMVQFDSRFVAAEKTARGNWRVTLSKHGADFTMVCRALVFATGSHNAAHARVDAARWAEAEAAGIETLHSSRYFSPEPFAGKRLLVVGVGASGADIAAKVSQTTLTTFVAVRTHPWVIPAKALAAARALARLGLAPDRLAADSRWLPTGIKQPLFSALIEITGRDLRRHGLGKPQHNLFDRVPVLDRGFGAALSEGRIAIRSDVAGFSAGAVQFAAGGEERIDTVIFATGYSRNYPFLPRAETGEPNIPCFFLFHPAEPGLTYMTEVIGAGSAWPVFVEQGRAIAAYFAAEERGGDTVPALNARRHVTPPSFKGRVFGRADDYHIDYRRYVHALRQLTSWLDR